MTDDLTRPETEEQMVRRLLQVLFAEGRLVDGRWCRVCRSDLSDVGTSSPSSISTAWPQGGHAPDCAAALLLEWLDGPSVYTRRRDAARSEA